MTAGVKSIIIGEHHAFATKKSCWHILMATWRPAAAGAAYSCSLPIRRQRQLASATSMSLMSLDHRMLYPQMRVLYRKVSAAIWVMLALPWKGFTGRGGEKKCLLWRYSWRKVDSLMSCLRGKPQAPGC